MVFLWDYDDKELRKTEKGRIVILERMINYGPGRKKKIRLTDVRKNWNALHLFELQRRLFGLLLWGKYRSSPWSKKSFFLG